MTREAKDEAREQRIEMEIIVDAYGPEEQAFWRWLYPCSDDSRRPVCDAH